MKRLLAFMLVIVSIISVAGNTPVLAEVSKNMCEATGESTTVKGDLNDTSLWEKGGISATGAEYSTQNYIRTKSYLAENIGLIYAENDYSFRAAIYDHEGSFLGFWNSQEISTTSKNLYYLNAAGLEGYKIRLFCQRFDSNFIDPTECSNIHFLSRTDKENATPRPTLTFIDDDGSFEALKNWEDICDETGIKITSALVTNVMGDENDPNRTKVSWTDVARLQEKGFEFVSHTHNHINITTTSEKACEADFKASIAALREHGCEYRYLVYPYNATNADRISLVKKYFEAAVGLGGTNANPGSDNTLPVYTHWLRRYSINEAQITKKVEYNGQTVDAHAFKDIDTLKGYVDDAIINNSWVIIMTHLRNDGSFYHDEESRQMIIELCRYAQEKGVEIQTFGEAYSNYKNLVETGNQSVYANTHYIVDCNGVAHYRGQNENGHIEETIPGKLATCVEPGLTDGKCCAACNEILIPQEEIPVSKEHIYDNDHDAVCNACYDIRKMVDTFTTVNYRVVFADEDVTHTNPRVVVYNIADSEVTDPSDEKILNAIDGNAKTHWGAQNINKISLSDAGNYVLLLKYNVGTAIVRVPMVIKIPEKPKMIIDNNNRITLLDEDETHINHRVIAYFVGDNEVEDIYDTAALKALDPSAQTHWQKARINKLALTKGGTYVLHYRYNIGTSAAYTVAQSFTVYAIPTLVIDQNNMFKATDENAGNKNHRVTIYTMGEELPEGLDIFDDKAVAAASVSSKTIWGLNAINKIEITEAGNYVVQLAYNIESGEKRIIALDAVLYERPVLSVTDENKLLTSYRNTAVITNPRATYYYFGSQSIEGLDIYDATALKAAATKVSATIWNQSRIHKTELKDRGNYVIHLDYNEKVGGAGSEKKTVAIAATIYDPAKPTLTLGEDNKLVFASTNADATNYRATIYNLGDETVEDIYNENALKAIDSAAATKWGAGEINKVQLTEGNNYVILVKYNLGTQTRTVAFQFSL